MKIDPAPIYVPKKGERAAQIAPEVGAYARAIFDIGEALSTLRIVQAVVTHLEKFPVQRAVAACLARITSAATRTAPHQAGACAAASRKGSARHVEAALDVGSCDKLPQVTPSGPHKRRHDNCVGFRRG